MVRGIFTSLEYLYAQFPTTGVTADALYPIVWDAVYNLESSGFRVVAFACDGATPNRKFSKMHANGNKLVYKTPNIYSSDPGDEIYFFSDVPHLVKTTRNCWSNSFAHLWSRALWVNVTYLLVNDQILYPYRRMTSTLAGVIYRTFMIETLLEHQV